MNAPSTPAVGAPIDFWFDFLSPYGYCASTHRGTGHADRLNLLEDWLARGGW